MPGADLRDVDLRRMGDLDAILRGGGARRQSLRGFEERYRDIVDYIVRITHRIWEEADMGYIYATYAPGCVVHTGSGTVWGVEEVVSGSVAMLAGFPDRRMHPEDVLWCGDDEAGFHTSHLIANTATNLGYSPWGPPTGREVRFLAIANCFVRANRIHEEWLVRDTAAVARQLGFDPVAIARRMPGPDPDAVTGETDRLRGQHPPAPYEPRHERENGHEHPEDLVRRFFHDGINGRRFGLVDATHAPGAEMRLPNHVRVQGPANVRAYLLALVAPFPDAHLNVEQVMWLGDAAEGWRVAARWRLSGSHRRYGLYGSPTGRRVDVLGISQLHVRDGRIHRHTFVFDELALLGQLLGGTAPAPD